MPVPTSMLNAHAHGHLNDAHIHFNVENKLTHTHTHTHTSPHWKCNGEKSEASQINNRAMNVLFTVPVHLSLTGCNQLNGGWRYTWTFMSDMDVLYHALQSRWRVIASPQPGHGLGPSVGIFFLPSNAEIIKKYVSAIS